MVPGEGCAATEERLRTAASGLLLRFDNVGRPVSLGIKISMCEESGDKVKNGRDKGWC